MLTLQRNGIGFGFWVCPPFPTEQPAKTRIAYNGPRVCEPGAKAQRLRLLATAVTERGFGGGSAQLPNAANPLLAEVARGVPTSPFEQSATQMHANRIGFSFFGES